METASKMRDLAFEWAKRSIEETQEEPLPCFLAMNEKNEIIIIGTPFDDEDSKDKTVELLKMLFYWKRIVAYSFCSTAWMATDKISDPKSDLPPSKRSDRKEVVLVLVQTSTENLMTTAEIIRSKNNVMTIGEPDSANECAGGRFANLLPPDEIKNLPVPPKMAVQFEKRFGPRDFVGEDIKDITLH